MKHVFCYFWDLASLPSRVETTGNIESKCHMLLQIMTTKFYVGTDVHNFRDIFFNFFAIHTYANGLFMYIR